MALATGLDDLFFSPVHYLSLSLSLILHLLFLHISLRNSPC